jgi:hypothetical protein
MSNVILSLTLSSKQEKLKRAPGPVKGIGPNESYEIPKERTSSMNCSNSISKLTCIYPIDNLFA